MAGNQPLQHQPLANLKPVVKCTASYIKELEEVREAFDLAYDHLCDMHFAATQPICKGSGFLGVAIKEMEKTAKTNKIFIAKKLEEA